jgi:hypothetical protein
MNKNDNLDSLIHIDAYVDFLQGIYAIRESLIQQMHDTTSDRIQQISGRILQCDDILGMGGYDRIVSRRGNDSYSI